MNGNYLKLWLQQKSSTRIFYKNEKNVRTRAVVELIKVSGKVFILYLCAIELEAESEVKTYLSAIGNVASLKCVVPDNFIELVNAHLPSDIRITGVNRRRN